MSEPAEGESPPPKKGSKKGLILGLLLAVLLGGGGFYATWSGLILGDKQEEAHVEAVEPLPDVAFVPLEPVIISLGPAAGGGQLRMTSQVEVAKEHVADVTLLMPRILDVLNSYLRAVDVAEIQDPTALVRLRSQMLRRIQTVAGDGRVRDLLITEFVLN